MKRLLVAGFAALAVVLGLVVTTGVASAAAPDAWTHCVPAPTATPPVTCPTHVPHPGFPGGFPGHTGFPSHGAGGHWIPGGQVPWGGPTLYGHQLWLNAQLGLDICGYGSSYSTFVNRNLSHRADIDRYLGASRWQTLYSSDCNSGLAVVPNGLSLVNGNLLNLSLLGLSGAGTVDVCDYPDYNVFSSRFGGRYGNRWDSVRNHFGSNGFNVYRQLRVNARCTTVVVPSSTTIVQAPTTTVEAAPADPNGVDGVSNAPAAAPAPLASSQLPANAPAVAPSTGGVDINAVLAQARVA